MSNLAPTLSSTLVLVSTGRLSLADLLRLVPLSLGAVDFLRHS